MPELLGVKSSKLSLMDALLIAGAKISSEKILSAYVGNGSIMSGAIKLVGGSIMNKAVSGKAGDIIGTALIVDGAEDVVTAFFGGATASGMIGSKQAKVNLI